MTIHAFPGSVGQTHKITEHPNKSNLTKNSQQDTGVNKCYNPIVYIKIVTCIVRKYNAAFPAGISATLKNFHLLQYAHTQKINTSRGCLASFPCFPVTQHVQEVYDNTKS